MPVNDWRISAVGPSPTASSAGCQLIGRRSMSSFWARAKIEMKSKYGFSSALWMDKSLSEDDMVLYTVSVPSCVSSPISGSLGWIC